MATEKIPTTTRGRNEAPSATARRAPVKGGSLERKHTGKTVKAEDAGTDFATERAVMIAQAAYLRAERRGFVPGHELEDWLAAEREVNHLLGRPAPVSSQT